MFIYLFVYLQDSSSRGLDNKKKLTEQAPPQGPEKNNNTDTYNNDNALETSECCKRVNGTCSVREGSVTVGEV